MRKRKLLSMVLTAATVTGMLAGCTNSSSNPDSSNAPEGSKTEQTDGSKSENNGGGSSNSDEGKVINIYSWNDEFRTRLEAIYPEVEKTSADGTVTTLKDGTEIHWIINPNQDGVYQQKLDEALLRQADAAADDKIDIFLFLLMTKVVLNYFKTPLAIISKVK